VLYHHSPGVELCGPHVFNASLPTATGRHNPDSFESNRSRHTSPLCTYSLHAVCSLMLRAVIHFYR